MLRRVTPALLAWVALGAPLALAQVPAPVAPPGARPAGMPVAPGGAPAIPVTPNAASPALPPPPVATTAGAPLANASAVPGGPPLGGVPGVVNAAVNAVLPPAPTPQKREPKENEVEITRVEYRGRLAACIQFRSDCSVRGLTRADQDYLRYELKTQRFTGMMLDEIVDARMLQFDNELTVIAPKKGGNPDWHAEMARGSRSQQAGAGTSFGMSSTEAQREAGGNVKTRYVPWSKPRTASSDDDRF